MKLFSDFVCNDQARPRYQHSFYTKQTKAAIRIISGNDRTLPSIPNFTIRWCGGGAQSRGKGGLDVARFFSQIIVLRLSNQNPANQIVQKFGRGGSAAGVALRGVWPARGAP